MNSICTNRNRTSEKWIELCKQERNRSRKCRNRDRNRTYQSSCTKINRKKVSGETCYRKCCKSEARAHYPGLSIHFAGESVGRFGKMAERFSRPQTLSSDNIADIVRGVVGAFGNLPSNPSNESGSASSSGSGARPSYVDTQHELHDRFRIPMCKMGVTGLHDSHARVLALLIILLARV